MPCTARAIVVPRFGGPEVLELMEREVDEPSSGRVRVAVRAIGVNPIDWKLRRGDLAGMMPVELPVVPGVELAGIVDAVGPGVTDLAVGDAIFGRAAAAATRRSPWPTARRWPRSLRHSAGRAPRRCR